MLAALAQVAAPVMVAVQMMAVVPVMVAAVPLAAAAGPALAVAAGLWSPALAAVLALRSGARARARVATVAVARPPTVAVQVHPKALAGLEVVGWHCPRLDQPEWAVQVAAPQVAAPQVAPEGPVVRATLAAALVPGPTVHRVAVEPRRSTAQVGMGQSQVAVALVPRLPWASPRSHAGGQR